ncbi:MAG: replicative DNA helicase [Patescibacteria group bacterium]|nr:replicative DNA helicase [Patescibacteria group bacterium]
MQDRLPPHSLEAEQGALGCVLLSPNECLCELMEKNITPESFFDLRHREIYSECVEMSKSGVPIDVITIQQRLKDRKKLEQIGGISYLSQLQDSVPSAANLSYYLDIVLEKYLLRKMVQSCIEAVSKIYDYEGKVDGLIDEIETKILAVKPAQKEDVGIKQLVQEAIGKIEQKCLSDGSITGLSTGLVDLDRLTDGIHRSEMIVLAALPSRGKTALAVNIAVLNALKGIPVAIISAEMRPVQLVVRSICSESRTNFHRISLADVPRMTVAASAISKAPLFIEQASGFTIGQVRAVGRRLKQKHDIQLMVIDYQQRLTGTGDNTEQRTASISKGVKDLCMELNIPTILLSQVNEAGQTKHARATTEDCDSLWKLENDSEWQPLVQPVKLNVEKCRDGQTGTVHLTFLKDITRFENQSKVDDNDYPT